MKTNWKEQFLLDRPSWALAVLLLAAVPVAGLYAAIDAPPVYQGKQMGVWLRELQNQDWSIRKQAERAVQHFGPAALPGIVQLMRARESLPRDQLVELVPKCAWTRVYLLTGFELQNCGIKACEVLGPVARPALPDLVHLLRVRPCAALVNALAAIGPEATEALTVGLLDSKSDVRVWSAYGIGRLYALEQRTRLARVAPQPDRPSSLRTAGKFSREAAFDLRSTVTNLIKDMEDPEPRVRAAAAWALGKLGEPALAAMPRLVEALSDSDPLVRGAAARALRSLASEHASAAEPNLSTVFVDLTAGVGNVRLLGTARFSNHDGGTT